jgi:hypothetical protein
MKKYFYTKETGERFDADIITLWQTVFLNICMEKARLLIGTDAFRLGLLASQAEVIYKCRVDERLDNITPFLENTLKIARTQELDLLGTTFELEYIQELVDDYLNAYFIVVNEGSI